MNEFITKLIERLEGREKYYHECALDEIMKNGHTLDAEGFLGKEDAYGDALSIVNQLAGKYNNESVKGDLINRSAAIDVIWDVFNQYCNDSDRFDEYETEAINRAFKRLQSTLEKQPTAYVDGWIPCSERLPEVETEVYITAKRKYRNGEVRYIITTAMYEDGTVLENDSCWRWEDIDGEWDEENDCYIIPEGWWENRHYNPDDVYNNTVDDKVIAWMPLPEPFKPKEEPSISKMESVDWKQHTMNRFERVE